MGFGREKMPAAPPVPPPLPPALPAVSPQVATGQANASRAAQGFAGTILTSPQGVPQTQGAGKTLLGD